MVTRDELREHLGRRPFKAFRVTLIDGKSVYITRTAQAVASRNQFIVGDDEKDRFRWIPLELIDHVEVLESTGPAVSASEG
jgi:hypothetical protein